MSFTQKLKEEIKSVLVAALYFGCWIFSLLIIKTLVLAEYEIVFQAWTMALVGALILSKVVLVLEKVPLGPWVRRQPAWVEILLRTALYCLGVALVLIVEKGLEDGHAQGGFVPAVQHLFQQADRYHVGANLLCLSGALLGYNILFAVRQHLGQGGLLRVFMTSLPEEAKGNSSCNRGIHEK